MRTGKFIRLNDFGFTSSNSGHTYYALSKPPFVCSRNVIYPLLNNIPLLKISGNFQTGKMKTRQFITIYPVQ